MGSFLPKGVSNPGNTGGVDLSFYTALSLSLRTLYCKRSVRAHACAYTRVQARTHMCLSLAMTASRKQRDRGASIVGAAKELLLLKSSRGDGAHAACTVLPKE